MARQITPTYNRNGAQLYVGDCAEVMAALPAESVDAIVTSPPYAMQRKTTYGGIPEKEYPSWTVKWMAEARRVLKPDGSVIINIRPHIKNGQISDYVLRTRLGIRADGWTECEEIIWNKKSGAPMGSTKRPRRSWESLLWFAKHGRPYSDPKAGGKESAWSGTPSKFKDGHTHNLQLTSWAGRSRVTDVVDMSVRLSADSDGTADHPAPFPWQLAEWCGKLITPPGGTILDPFNGSASTGVAALRNGWQYIGIDAAPEYIEMSGRRLDQEIPPGPAQLGLYPDPRSNTP